MAVLARATGRPAKDRLRRRWELYRRAAPVFRRWGYRQVTMKALAAACGLRPASLYHYFPSKRDFALFPLLGESCANLLDELRAVSADPLVHLRELIDFSVEMDRSDGGATYAILSELGSADDVRGIQLEAARHTRWVFEEVARAAAPALSAEGVADLAESLLSIIVAALFDSAMGRPPEVLRRELVTVARAYLVEAGVDAQRVDKVLAEPSLLALLG